jgi:putative membrane protein
MTPNLVNSMLAAVIFSAIGIAVFSLFFLILDKLTPYDLWKEICENKNTALAFLVGMMSLGICIIIAASIHG